MAILKEWVDFDLLSTPQKKDMDDCEVRTKVDLELEELHIFDDSNCQTITFQDLCDLRVFLTCHKMVIDEALDILQNIDPRPEAVNPAIEDVLEEGEDQAEAAQKCACGFNTGVPICFDCTQVKGDE